MPSPLVLGSLKADLFAVIETPIDCSSIALIIIVTCFFAHHQTIEPLPFWIDWQGGYFESNASLDQ
jgi:hypothetical protein